MRNLGVQPSSAESLLVKADIVSDTEIGVVTINTTATVAPGMTVSLGVGTYAIRLAACLYAAGAPALSMTVAFSGTQTAFSLLGMHCTNAVNPTITTGFSLGVAKSLGSIPTGGSFWAQFHGVITVTVSGTFTVSFTRTGGTTLSISSDSAFMKRV